jgi:5'(3')-deoxyribonucleotidase
MKVFIDMDGVLANFYASPHFKGEKRSYHAHHEMHEIGFFEGLPPIEGAFSAVREILYMYPRQVFILTQPVPNTFYSYSEKVVWINKWFPELKDNIILTQNKELVSAKDRVLIDDNEERWGIKWEDAGGKFLKFQTELDHRTEWRRIINCLKVLTPTF